MSLLDLKFKGDSLARSILRYGALIAAVSMIAYGVMLFYADPSFINLTSLDPSIEVVLAVSLGWVLLSAMTSLTNQPSSVLVGMLEVGAYFTLAASQTWLISGFTSPFSAYWVLLLVATYALFNRIGLQIGAILFVIVLVVDIASFGLPINFGHAVTSILTATAILVTSFVIVAVYSSQRASQHSLAVSHAKEEARNRHVVTLINNITDAVFSTNQDGIVKIYNSAALNILDTNDKIRGKFIGDLIQLEDTNGKKVDAFFELSKNNTIRQRDDLILRFGDEDSIRLEATFAPVQGSSSKSNIPNDYVLILRDITRMKSLEEERDEFISVVSHELRTPVAIAEGSLSNAEILVEKGHKGKTTEAIGEAHKQVLFLAKMVNDLSTLSRAERSTYDKPERIDVTALAHQMYGEYTPQAEEKGLELNLDITGRKSHVHVSPLYLKELLQNLITNAIKYTPSGSVTLKVKELDEKILFEVIDTGIGIGKADLRKIFDRFYRAEDYRTRETSGTGLGLYVATKLAKKLGCKLEVKSRLNHGSTFSFAIDKADDKNAKKKK